MTLQLSPFTEAAVADSARSLLVKRLVSRHPQPVLQALASTPALLSRFKGELAPELLLDAAPMHSPDIAALIESERALIAASVFLPLPDALVGRVASFLDARTALRLPSLCHHAYALRCGAMCPMGHAVLEISRRIRPDVAELLASPTPHPNRDPLIDLLLGERRPDGCSSLARFVDPIRARHRECPGREYDRDVSYRGYRGVWELDEGSADSAPPPQSLQSYERMPVATVVRSTVLLSTLSTLVMHLNEELLGVLEPSAFLDAAVKHMTNLEHLLISFDTGVRGGYTLSDRASTFLHSLLRANSHSLVSVVLMGGEGLSLADLHFPRLSKAQFIDSPGLRLADIRWPQLRLLDFWNSWGTSEVTEDRRRGNRGLDEERPAADRDSVNHIGACLAEVPGLQSVTLELGTPENRPQLLSVLRCINRGVSDRRGRVVDQLDGPLLWSPAYLFIASLVDPKAVARHLGLLDLLEGPRDQRQAALQPLWEEHHFGLLTDVLQNAAPHEFQFHLNTQSMVRTAQSFEVMCNFIARLPDILAAAVAKNPSLPPPIQPGAQPMPEQGLREIQIAHSACRPAAEGREDAVSEAGSDESDVDVQFGRRSVEYRYRRGKRITRAQRERAVAGLRGRIAGVLRDRYDLHMEFLPGCCRGEALDAWRFFRYKAPTYKEVLLGTQPLIPPSQLPGRQNTNTCSCSATVQ